MEKLTTVKILIGLYNRGIESFQNGIYDQAISDFTTAFSVVSEKAFRDGLALNLPIGPIVQSSDLSPSFSVPVPFLKSPSTTENTMVFFPLALQLPKYYTIDQFGFTILYNLALVTHISSLVYQSQENSQGLNKALELWELLYSIHWQDELKLGPHHTLAILSNLAHSRRTLGDERSSKACYENILSTLECMRNFDVVEEDFFVHQSFFITLAHRMLYSNAAAAA